MVGLARLANAAQLDAAGLARHQEHGRPLAEQQAIDKAEAEAKKKAEFQAQQSAAMSGGGGIEDLLGGAAAESPRGDAPDAGESILDMLEARQDDTADGSDAGDVLSTEAAQQGDAGTVAAEESETK